MSHTISSGESRVASTSRVSIGAIVSVSSVRNFAAFDEARADVPAAESDADAAPDAAAGSARGSAGAMRTRLSMRMPKPFGLDSVATRDVNVNVKKPSLLGKL